MEFSRLPSVEVLEDPKRLSVMAALVPVRGLPSGELRKLVGCTETDLTKHLKALRTAGYVQVQKWGNLRGVYLQIVATEKGRDAIAKRIRSLDKTAKVGALVYLGRGE